VTVLDQLHVRAEPAAVTQARHWVRERAAEAGLPLELARDLQLLTSEMVTAAVRSGDGPITVTVTVDDFAIRVDVADRHGDVTDQLEERGLDLVVDGIDVVHAVSAEWDWRPTADGGKTVWALLIRDL